MFVKRWYPVSVTERKMKGTDQNILGMVHIHLICTDKLVPQYATITGVLHLHQEALLKLDFIHGAQFLTRLPDDLAADLLFRSIEAIHMNVGKQRFSEVLAHHIDKCQHEQS